ncbi:VOC family protein [Phaeacidiphilus oryzae]|uniref:VOC family protein n=1 Tax=Phaeacidiphilus oryzae TaxID=348818 RepID=UPI00068DAE7F|nr:VOC family protein [Phaeacidiphilus oryzae]
MPAEDEAPSWAGGVALINLFVADLDAARAFYRRVFGRPVEFEDDRSTAFRFGEVLVNLLDESAAPGVIAPAVVAAPGGGSRFALAMTVPDVDAACAELRTRGVELLNGPVDHPWGMRTAAFADPDGNVWEIASPV